MSTKKSAATKLLQKLSGGPLTMAKILTSHRLKEDISQTEFAKKLGISRAHLCDLEKGRRRISPERAAKFAKALQMSERLYVCIALQEMIDSAGLKMIVEVKAA